MLILEKKQATAMYLYWMKLTHLLRISQVLQDLNWDKWSQIAELTADILFWIIGKFLSFNYLKIVLAIITWNCIFEKILCVK